MPFLSDWSSDKSWQEAGSKAATERANAQWKSILKESEQPAMDPAFRDAIDALIAVRTREGGAPPVS
jgi:trimethylamine--corrinoid protein Co-methyltransferase